MAIGTDGVKCSRRYLSLHLWIQWKTTVGTKPGECRHVLLSHANEKLRDNSLTLHFLAAASDPYEAAIDDAIATCDGDLRGAVRALLVANEILERDL